MLYLSLYCLSYGEALKLRLKDTYSLHRIVYGLFPLEVNKGARILYADRGFQKGLRKILILSRHGPEGISYGTLQTKIVPEQFLDFSAYDFEITINPVRRIHSTGRIEPVRKRHEIWEWFKSREKNWGFESTHLEVGSVWVDSFHKCGDKPVTLSKANISGILEVRERGLFATAFRDGLGRGRAFGCGLLQLKPVTIL